VVTQLRVKEKEKGLLDFNGGRKDAKKSIAVLGGLLRVGEKQAGTQTWSWVVKKKPVLKGRWVNEIGKKNPRSHKWL